MRQTIVAGEYMAQMSKFGGLDGDPSKGHVGVPVPLL